MHQWRLKSVYRSAIVVCCAIGFLIQTGCHTPLRRNSISPQEVSGEFLAQRRTELVPLDHRILGATIPPEHTVGAEDVLGIYVADVIGKRDELPQVFYPSFRTRNAPIEPFIGQPIKVESDGMLHLPYIEPLQVSGLTLPQVREAIRNEYVFKKPLVQADRANISVTLITPRYVRINVFRQDSRYNTPGLQSQGQTEISRRWSGTTLFLEPKESTVLSALMKTGGLPGIDARNEIWVMKGTDEADINRAETPVDLKLPGDFPIMLPKENTKLIRIPLHYPVGTELPFTSDDVILGDGDVVFLPRRDGDVFMTGGLLPPGRIPLARDRDTDVLEAIALATGSIAGPVGQYNKTQFNSGPGGIVPPTQVTIVRRTNEDKQIKIRVDLNKALSDPSERVIIAPGDLIILKYRFDELMANMALNFFDFNVSLAPSASGVTVDGN